MPPKTTSELRSAYLEFFKSKGHAVIPGASLVPVNDPTVLFTTAGMHPLVPYLMGEVHPAGKRLVDVQCCVRTQDIDEVGDASHLTMFEMMGNWSLGDYFKQGAIEMSFEFLTQVLGIPLHMLAVTCFEGDEVAPRDTESAEIWKKLGVPESRIGWLPKAKNWWGPAGKTGPCGPDSEMFYWVGEGDPQGNPATHDAQWMEIWNDVFMQYNKKEDGTFEPLAQQNVDTGMGLERVAAVLQGVTNVYDTDAMIPLMQKVRLLASGLDTATALRETRVIVDHLKASTFMIADGVLPSNVDQGYILRRLIRRAIRSARKLHIQHTGSFSPEIATAVIDQYSGFYKNLASLRPFILDTLQKEEVQFEKALQEGTKQFEKARTQSTSVIDGLSAFHLYDTFGFPIEMTVEMAAEHGMTVDTSAFNKAFEAHQALSRAGAAQKFAGGLADNSAETTKLHTATHLLNHALRTVLGEHVWQKGSNITAERLRFDFSHPDKMTEAQIKQVEALVNDAIKADVPVSYTLMSVSDAKASGAIGVFDAKYADKVKVYTMGAFSKEICGGPHVARTGMLGSFTIQKEESSSSGVRRIKAIVSGGPQEIAVAGEEVM